MQENNMIDLLGSLKEMSSEQLSRLIQEETAKELPNDDLVLMALDVLEDREKENLVELGPKGKAAWKKYQSKVQARQRKTVLLWKPVVQVASALLIITMLFALLPTQANAETWWERLARWTDDFFSFFIPNESEELEDQYEFQTDNEGLHHVYEALGDFGITEPIVPMWIPEEYAFQEIKVESMPRESWIMSRFSAGEKELVFQIRIINGDVSSQFHKDETRVAIYEKSGTTYNILQNQNINVIVWAIDNIECSIFIDCQEDTLYKVIDSIYRWRNNE